MVTTDTPIRYRPARIDEGWAVQTRTNEPINILILRTRESARNISRILNEYSSQPGN